MSLLAQLDQRIRHHGGLIVSCQPVPGSPLDNPSRQWRWRLSRRER